MRRRLQGGRWPGHELHSSCCSRPGRLRTCVVRAPGRRSPAAHCPTPFCRLPPAGPQAKYLLLQPPDLERLLARVRADTRANPPLGYEPADAADAVAARMKAEVDAGAAAAAAGGVFDAVVHNDAEVGCGVGHGACDACPDCCLCGARSSQTVHRTSATCPFPAAPGRTPPVRWHAWRKRSKRCTPHSCPRPWCGATAARCGTLRRVFTAANRCASRCWALRAAASRRSASCWQLGAGGSRRAVLPAVLRAAGQDLASSGAACSVACCQAGPAPRLPAPGAACKAVRWLIW